MCLISETVAGGRSHPRDAIIRTLRFKVSQPVPAGRRGSGSTADQKPFEWERCHRAADGLWRGLLWSPESGRGRLVARGFPPRTACKRPRHRLDTDGVVNESGGLDARRALRRPVEQGRRPPERSRTPEG